MLEGYTPRVAFGMVRLGRAIPLLVVDFWLGLRYFVTIRVGARWLGEGAGGETVNVTHVFQPWGRFSATNSL